MVIISGLQNNISKTQNHIFAAYLSPFVGKKEDEIFEKVTTDEHIKFMEAELRKEKPIMDYAGKDPLKAAYNLKRFDGKYYLTAQVTPPGSSTFAFILCRIGQDKDGNLSNNLYPISVEAADELAKPIAEKEIAEKKLSGDKAEEIRKKLAATMEAMFEELAINVFNSKSLVKGIEKEFSK